MPLTPPARDLDLDLLDRVVELIGVTPDGDETLRTREHPNGVTVVEDQRWNQYRWRNVEPVGLDIVADNPAPRCQTGMCFAGWVAELCSDDEPVRWQVTARELHLARMTYAKASNAYMRTDDENVSAQVLAEALDKASNDFHKLHEDETCVVDDRWADLGDGDFFGAPSVGVWAQWRLGITEEQASLLFAGGNDLDDLQHVIGHLHDDPSWSSLRDTSSECDECIEALGGVPA